jgi:hypothetical protein
MKKFLGQYKKIPKNKGAAMLISVVFFIFISLAISAGLVLPTVKEFKIAKDNIVSRQSYFLAESGLEDVYFRLNNAIPVGASSALTIGGNTVNTVVTNSGYNEKTILSEGSVSNLDRKNQIILSTGTGIAFNYGIQTGQGGFSIYNATVNGNVYSDGSILGLHNDSTIIGTAISAGPSGLIDNMNIGQSGQGNALAHTVSDSVVQGTIYCKSGSGNNKSCNTSLSDPDYVPMPITQEMIDQWKLDAVEGGVVSGNMTISSPTQLGPKKINGNLTVNANLTLTGTIYVTGRVIFSNNVHVSLSSGYGASGGILLTDGYVNLSNNVLFEGSGTANTFVMLVTTSHCPVGCSGINALEISNNVGAVTLNAQNGTAHIDNNVTLNEIVADRIIMDNNAFVDYLSGLANTSFSSGPSGGWNIRSWKEVK